MLAPLLGIFVLLPPLVTLFVGPRWAFGVPLIFAYLFGVWAVLIGFTWWLGRHLQDADEPAADSTGSDPGASDSEH